MARKATNATTEMVEVTTPAPEVLLAQQNTAAAMTEQAMKWMELSMNAGQIRAAIVAETVSSRIIAESYSRIVESKAYIGFPFKNADGQVETVSSLEQFCEVVFGRTARRCQQIAAAAKTLGIEAFEAAERLGLGQRDYNALKALPADEQQVIKLALEDGADKKTVIEKLVNFVGRHAIEREQLQSELNESREDNKAKSDRIAKHVAEVERLETDLRKTKQRIKTAKPSEVAKDLVLEIEKALIGAETHLKTIFEGLQQLLQDDTHQEVEAALARVGMGLVAPTAEVLACLSSMGVKSPAQSLCAGLEDAV